MISALLLVTESITQACGNSIRLANFVQLHLLQHMLDCTHQLHNNKSEQRMRKSLRGKVLMGILSGLLAACAGERPKNLGAKDGVLAACPASPNCVSSQSTSEKQRIAPLAFSGDPEAAFVRLRELLRLRSDTTIIEENSGYLRVEFHTTFFVDDGEFLLDHEHPVIQVRSASRLGYSDLGKNRSRMENIRREFTRQPVRSAPGSATPP